MTATVQAPAVAAAIHTPLLATPLQLLRCPGLTTCQRDARTGVALRLADLRYALGQPGAPDLEDAAGRLLEAMADADAADAMASRGYLR
jgi:hypothetical protein